MLGHNTKFGVLQDVGNRYRAGAEAAWSMGPLAFAGEYLVLKYTELETVSQRHDAEFSSWYLSGAYCLTGEHFSLAGGTVNPIHPNRFFDPKENTWGAFIQIGRAHV